MSPILGCREVNRDDLYQIVGCVSRVSPRLFDKVGVTVTGCQVRGRSDRRGQPHQPVSSSGGPKAELEGITGTPVKSSS